MEKEEAESYLHKKVENGARVRCYPASVSTTGSAEPTLTQVPDREGTPEIMAMLRSLTGQPITAPVASLLKQPGSK